VRHVVRPVREAGANVNAEEQVRVSTLELFFDLVFVFTITQLTSVLADEPTAKGVLRVVLMLTAIWWMYDAFAWLTNAMPPNRLARRLFLLGGMACFFVLSLAIPRAFSGDGVTFAIAYLVVICVHAGLYTGAAAWPTFRDVLGFARFNATAAVLILAAGIVGGTWQYVLWAAALAVIVSVRWLLHGPGDPITASHFVERHGLVVIVALGESVVAVGIGARSQSVSGEMIAVAVLGLALSACLWWTYFGGDEEEAERAMAATPVPNRARVALDGFYSAHLLILFGIIAVAAALEQAIAHPFDPLDFAHALFLGGGAAGFLLGDVLFCRVLAIPHSVWRIVGAALALATIPLGTAGSALLQLAALVLALAACLAAEVAQAREAEPAGLR
jgi:low temperature requirement protein LtrA